MLIGDFIGELIGELLSGILNAIIPTSKSKLEKNIGELRGEDWFSQLDKDVRYNYIIWYNKKVKRFLSNEKNIKMITSMDFERENFIHLVKEEHAKFTGLRS